MTGSFGDFQPNRIQGHQPLTQICETFCTSSTLPLLTLYGLGTTVGAGIYVLVGKVAGLAGIYAPVSFLVAALLVTFTIFSFAELAARLPRCAGEAIYVQSGFGWWPLALGVGLLVALSGVVSSGTIVGGAAGYAREFVALPAWLVMTLLALLLGILAGWGISQSVTIASLVTLVEIAGLLAVIWAVWRVTPDLAARLPQLAPPADAVVWGGVFSGSILAFYAFIGFEDMVNVAEEVERVETTLPRAIMLTLAITSLLYFAVALVAVLAIPAADLAASEAPLARLWERGSGLDSTPISLIAVFATLNGALIQIIMATRVLYGLSREGWLPAVLGRIDRRTRTPLIATAVVTLAVLGFALWLPLQTLAEITSTLVLIVFTLVNLALIRIKRRQPAPPGVRGYPIALPMIGATVNSAVLLYILGRAL